MKRRKHPASRQYISSRIDSRNLASGYKFADSRIFNVNTTLPVNEDQQRQKYVRLFKSYDFTLPVVKGATGLWRFEASMATDFVIGGSLGYVQR